MLTNVQASHAMFMLTALTLLELINVFAKMDLLAMDYRVFVSAKKYTIHGLTNTNQG